MSAITNKDRITENNDKINRLIELAKQKGLTSNPKPATTESEMDAMITDKNVGKVVKYLGENGGKYEKDALYIIAEGDETGSGLFARRLNITEGTLSITENGTYDVTNKASVDVNVAGGGGSDSNKLALVVGTQYTNIFYDITASDLDGVTEIRSYAFYNCTSLASIDLPNVTSLGDYAFNNCPSLTSANMPNVTSLGNSAFNYCPSLTSANMPNVTSLGNHAFYNCRALTSANMPNVRSLGTYAFQNCTALTSVFIGSACNSIASYALRCGSSTNRCTFTFLRTTPPSIQSNTFTSSYINKIIVPIGCGEAYKTATNWSSFASYIEEATE